MYLIRATGHVLLHTTHCLMLDLLLYRTLMYVKFPLLSSRTVSAPIQREYRRSRKKGEAADSLLSIAQFQISHLRDTAPSLCSTRLSFRFLGQVMRYSPR
jgi:hypothetical protein